MSATRADLIRAKRLVRLVTQRGSVPDTELPGLLDCGWEDTRRALGIARRWGRVDYADAYIVATPSDEGSPAA